MPVKFYDKYAFAIKWISIAILIKFVLFIVFALNFIQNWPQHWVTNFIFISSGDTTGYYDPIDSFVKGNGYASFCRMPGLLPIYAPLNFLFGEIWGKTFVIVLQFLTSSLSVYVLARTAGNIFNNIKIFYITFFLYAISSFVSIWDHYGYSDSFSTSLIVFSVYFFVRYFQARSVSFLILSGSFATWSLFFRPINGLIFACMLFILFINLVKNFRFLVKEATLLVLPCFIAISAWTAYNYSKHKKLILLQGSFSECYVGLPAEHLAIRDLIIAWGGDFQEWSIGTEAEWFFSKTIDYRSKNFFAESVFTPQYNLDSLIKIKVGYDSLRSNAVIPENVRSEIQNKIILSANNFRAAYIDAHPFRYYFLNRIKFIQRFMFPMRLDNLPFPKVSEMKIYQKLTKGCYLLLLNFVTLTGLIGILLSFSIKNLYGIIPLISIVVIAGVLGFVEQRYLVPEYPFLVIYSAYLVERLLTSLSKRKNALPS